MTCGIVNETMRKRLLFVGIILVIIIVVTIVLKETASAPFQRRTATDTTTSTKPAFDKHTFSTTDPASIWVIVNKQHPLDPKTYAPGDLVSVGNGQYMRAEAAAALTRMLSDAKTAGFVVTPQSGYRSYDTQVVTYNSEVRAFGQATADTESARPGYSEHQTGLAIDLGSNGCNITDCFSATPGGQWVTAHAYLYGFILRYQANDTDVTGYRAEAWHFRYIGVSLATELHNEHVITLEQFFSVSGSTTYR